jgi:hypothetical protein
LVGPVYSNGSWTYVSGPNSVTPTPGSNSTNATVTGMIPGTYVFNYAEEVIGSCLAKNANLTINITAVPTVAIAGVDKDLCDQTGWTMSANTVAVTETGTWLLMAGAPNTPTISNANDSLATITGAIAGVYTYKWTIKNTLTPACLSEDLVVIRISTSPSAAVAGSNQTICGTVATMNATPVTGGLGTWSKVSGTGGAITSANGPTSTITGLSAGTYVYRWTASNGVCATTTSDVSITVNANPSTPNAGVDQTLCAATTTTLAATSLAVGTGLWSLVSGPVCTITTPSSRTSTVTELNTGVYILKWTATNPAGGCVLSDQMIITNYAAPSTAVAGSNFHTCLYSPITLVGNTPLVGTGTWTQTVGTAVTITSPTSPTTTITGATAGAYTFRWTIANGVCTSSTSDVVVTVDPPPTQAIISGANQSLTGTSVSITGSTISVGTGLWSKQSGPAESGTITSPTSASTTITGLIDGTYVYRWTSTSGICTSFDEITITKNGYSCVISNKMISPILYLK